MIYFKKTIITCLATLMFINNTYLPMHALGNEAQEPVDAQNQPVDNGEITINELPNGEITINEFLSDDTENLQTDNNESVADENQTDSADETDLTIDTVELNDTTEPQETVNDANETDEPEPQEDSDAPKDDSENLVDEYLLNEEAPTTEPVPQEEAPVAPSANSPFSATFLSDFAIVDVDGSEYLEFEDIDAFPILNGMVVQIVSKTDTHATFIYDGAQHVTELSNLNFDVLSIPYYQSINGMVYYYLPIDATKPFDNNYHEGIFVAYNNGLDDRKLYYSFVGIHELLEVPALRQRRDAIVIPPISLVNQDYFRYLSFRSKSNYTAAELDAYIKYTNSRYSGLPNSGSCYFRDSQSAFLFDDRTKKPLSSPGAVLKDIEDKYGVNALFLLSMANHESCYGFSGFALSRNNFFGLMAYDASPESAAGFATRDEGLNAVGRYISDAYSDVSWDRYAGTHIGDSPVGPNASGVCPWDGDGEDGLEAWATGCGWQDALSRGAASIDAYLGHKDFNNYSIAEIKSGSTFYKDAVGTVSYTTRARAGVQYRQTIVGETPDYYIVRPDPSMTSNKTPMTAPKSIQMSRVDDNNPDYLLYKTSQKMSDIRNPASQFYIYKRTTGSTYGEYKHVDQNQLYVYVKKADVVKVRGASVPTSPVVPPPVATYSNALLSDTHSARVSGTTLTTEFLVGEKIGTTNTYRYVPNNQFRVYLEAADGTKIEASSKPVFTSNFNASFKNYSIQFDTTKMVTGKVYTLKVVSTDPNNTNKTPVTSWMPASRFGGFVPGSTKVSYTPVNDRAAYRNGSTYSNAVLSDTHSATVSGTTLTTEFLVGERIGTTNTFRYVPNNQFKVYLEAADGTRIESKNQPVFTSNFNGSFKNYSVQFDTSKMVMGKNYTFKVVSTDPMNTNKTPATSWMPAARFSGLVRGSSTLYFAPVNDQAVYRNGNTYSNALLSDTHTASVSGTTLTTEFLVGERVGTSNTYRYVPNNQFRVYLEAADGTRIESKNQPVFTSNFNSSYKNYSVQFDTTKMVTGKTYTFKVVSTDPKNTNKTPVTSWMPASRFAGLVRGSSSVYFAPVNDQAVYRNGNTYSNALLSDTHTARVSGTTLTTEFLVGERVGTSNTYRYVPNNQFRVYLEAADGTRIESKNQPVFMSYFNGSYKNYSVQFDTTKMVNGKAYTFKVVSTDPKNTNKTPVTSWMPASRFGGLVRGSNNIYFSPVNDRAVYKK